MLGSLCLVLCVFFNFFIIKIIKEACAARASTSQLFIQFSLLHQTTQHTPTVNFSLQRVTTTTTQLAQNYHVLVCCIGYQRYNHRCVYSVCSTFQSLHIPCSFVSVFNCCLNIKLQLRHYKYYLCITTTRSVLQRAEMSTDKTVWTYLRKQQLIRGVPQCAISVLCRVELLQKKITNNCFSSCSHGLVIFLRASLISYIIPKNGKSQSASAVQFASAFTCVTMRDNSYSKPRYDTGGTEGYWQLCFLGKWSSRTGKGILHRNM